MKQKLKIWLILSSVFCSILILVSLPMIMMSPMLFDAPGSTEKTEIYVVIFTLIAFPLVALISTILAWVLHKKNKIKGAFITSLLPYLNLVVFLFALLSWD